MEACFAGVGLADLSKVDVPLVAGSHSGNKEESVWGLQNIVMVNYTIVIAFGRRCCLMMFVKDR